MYATVCTFSSPNDQLSVTVTTTDQLYYSVSYQGKLILRESPLSMTLGDGTILGRNPKVKGTTENTVNEVLSPPWGIRNKIVNHYCEVTVEMEGNYSVIIRAYDEGIAYRFHTDLPDRIKVMNEEVAFRFTEDHQLISHVVGDFQTSYEKLYTRHKISEVIEKEFISLPIVVDQGDLKIAITEADLFDYPGMYLMRLGNNNRFDMLGLFPQYPTKWEPGGLCQFNLRVTERADYLAETVGTRDFPWRVMIVAAEDIELADNDLVYKLSRPSKIDTDWITTGKVAWDWWNAWNLEGVDFEAGVNNRTYEFYIDFAADNGLEYVIMDEGWSDQFDLLLQKPNIDVPHLVEYAKERNVQIVLWCVWHALDRNMGPVLDQFEAWGVAGTKVDFIDRDDQIAINFYERLAAESAKRKLLVNIHGCSKPTGLHRTYPNVINYEGVRGNEYNKFGKDETPGHNVDLVYTRMIAGPMDYTPGAMRNSTEGNFHMDNENTMSHGTRCHQLGMYVVYYSPMQMLCDAPTAYMKYPDILKFLGEVPAIWDETKALVGELGKYIAIARKKDGVWYVGALTDWTERTLSIDLSFLEEGEWEGEFFLDGINANRKAEDYRVEKKRVSASDTLDILLKKGGGAALVFRRG